MQVHTLSSRLLAPVQAPDPDVNVGNRVEVGLGGALVLTNYRQLVFAYTKSCETSVSYVGHTFPVTVTVANDKSLWTADEGGYVFRWNLKSGEPRWRSPEHCKHIGPVTSILVYNGILITGSGSGTSSTNLPDHKLRAWVAQSGTSLWVARQQQATAITHIGERVYCCTIGNKLQCRTMRTGAVRWESPTLQAQVSTIVAAGQRVYVGDVTGSVTGWHYMAGVTDFVVESPFKSPVSCIRTYNQSVCVATKAGHVSMWAPSVGSSRMQLVWVEHCPEPSSGELDGKAGAVIAGAVAAFKNRSKSESMGSFSTYDGARRSIRPGLSANQAISSSRPPNLFDVTEFEDDQEPDRDAEQLDEFDTRADGFSVASPMPVRGRANASSATAGTASSTSITSPSAAAKTSASSTDPAEDLPHATCMVIHNDIVYFGIGKRHFDLFSNSKFHIVALQATTGLRIWATAAHKGPVRAMRIYNGALYSVSVSSSILRKWDLRTGSLLCHGNATRDAVNMLTTSCGQVFASLRGESTFKAFPEHWKPWKPGWTAVGGERTTARVSLFEVASAARKAQGGPGFGRSFRTRVMRLVNQTTWVAEGHTDAIRGLYVGNDRVFSCSNDTSVAAWNASNGILLWRTLLSAGSLWSIFQLDGFVLAGSDTGVLTCLSVATGTILWRVDAHAAMIGCINGAQGLVFSGSEDNTVAAWEARSGKFMWRVDHATDNVGVENEHVRWARLRRTLSHRYDGASRFSMAEIKSATGVVERHDVWALAVIGDRLYSSAGDNSVRAWDLQSGHGVWCSYGHEGPVKCLAVGSSPPVLYSGSADHTVRAWDPETGRTLWATERCFAEISCLSVDGDTVFVGTQTGIVTISAKSMAKYQVQVLHQWAAEKSQLDWRISQHAPISDFWLQVFLLIVEFCQLAGFAFKMPSANGIGWLQDMFDWFQWLWPSNITWSVLRFCIISFVWVLVALLLMQETIHVRMVSNPSILKWKYLWLFVTALFKVTTRAVLLPIVAVLITPMKCITSGSNLVMSTDPSDICWSLAAPKQIILAIVCMVTLAVFLSLCTRLHLAGSQLKNVDVQLNVFDWSGDVFNAKSVHPLSYRDVKRTATVAYLNIGLLCVTTFFLENYLTTYMVVLLLCGLLLVALGIQFRPFFGGPEAAANKLRVMMDVAILWLYIVAVIAVGAGESFPPVWPFIFGGLAVLMPLVWFRPAILRWCRHGSAVAADPGGSVPGGDQMWKLTPLSARKRAPSEVGGRERVISVTDAV